MPAETSMKVRDLGSSRVVSKPIRKPRGLSSNLLVPASRSRRSHLHRIDQGFFSMPSNARDGKFGDSRLQLTTKTQWQDLALRCSSISYNMEGHRTASKVCNKSPSTSRGKIRGVGSYPLGVLITLAEEKQCSTRSLCHSFFLESALVEICFLDPQLVLVDLVKTLPLLPGGPPLTYTISEAPGRSYGPSLQMSVTLYWFSGQNDPTRNVSWWLCEASSSVQLTA